MAKKYTINYEIAFYECDLLGNLTIPMLLNIILKTSSAQSSELGGNAEEVATKFGLTWIIVQYEIEIAKLPKVDEKISITTLAQSYNKFFCYRDFWVNDASGNECAKIRATFVLMDLVNRKISTVHEDVIAPYECESATKIERGAKIFPVDNGEAFEYHVRFSDIDSNKHVNNAKYLDWMLDVLGYDFLITHKPKKINIKFETEVKYNNNIESHWECEELSATEILSKHQIKVAETNNALANIVWSKR